MGEIGFSPSHVVLGLNCSGDIFGALRHLVADARLRADSPQGLLRQGLRVPVSGEPGRQEIEPCFEVLIYDGTYLGYWCRGRGCDGVRKHGRHHPTRNSFSPCGTSAIPDWIQLL